jgi:hypothetical protein
MHEKRSYAALRRTAVFEVAGVEIEIAKIGSIALVERVSKNPVFAPFIEKLGSKQVGGGKTPGADDVKKAFKEAAAASGLSGKDIIMSLPRILGALVDDLIVGTAVVESEEQRKDLSGLVATFDEQELFLSIAPFLKLNMPTAYGPFVAFVEPILVGKATASAPVEKSAKRAKAA